MSEEMSYIITPTEAFALFPDELSATEATDVQESPYTTLIGIGVHV